MAETNDLSGRGDRSAAEIRQDLEEHRRSISHTVDELNRRLHESLEWRRYVADHPLAALGVAAGAGFLASRLVPRRRSPARRIGDAIADSFEDFTDTLRDLLGRWPAATERKSRSASSGLMAAALGLAGRAAMEKVKQKVAEAATGARAGHNGDARHRAPTPRTSEVLS
jgi:ElaB/YqjD/DUF883 family membrane-anchored ribosome-binding protein